MKSARVFVYPPKGQKVSLTVEPAGGILKSDPPYKGKWWTVNTATILTWEGGLTDTPAPITQGFCVRRGELPAFLDAILMQAGLAPDEIRGFKGYWVPILAVKPYVAIRFLSREEVERVAPLKVKPQPNSLVRVWFDFRPLNDEVKLRPQRMEPVTRSGFTVAEWGGLIYKD